MDETEKDVTVEQDNPSETQTTAPEEEKEIVTKSDEVVPNNLNNTSNEAEDTHSVQSESDVSERSRTESGDEVDNEEEDDASVILEREEGDGQESTPSRKVDDDEDKRNPQYIPKRGTFYEHDDRTATEGEADVESKEENEKQEKDVSKKKVWLEKDSGRWFHDKFNEQDQSPKSRTELVTIYGYDIRNEEGPPRARRRRRYGRGPNKYTRNWEDEDAYNRLPAPSTRGTPRRVRSKGEDFPALNSGRKSQSSENADSLASGDNELVQQTVVQESEIKPDKSKGDSVEPPPPPPPSKPEQPRLEHKPKPTERPPRKEPQPRDIRPPKLTKPPRNEEIPRGVSHGRGITRSRGFRGVGRGDNKPRKPPSDESSDYIVSQNFTNKSMSREMQEVEKEMAGVSLQNEYGRGKFNGPRQNSVPPRLQGEQRGSKRYSSLRQRSLPETGGQFVQQHPVIRYANEYGQQGPAQPNQQGILPHPAPAIVSQVPTNPQPILTVQPAAQPMGPIPLPGPANGPILPGPPPQFANHFPQGPPAFIQAPPPPFIPPQGPPPQIINYAQAPQFTQPDFANFQHQQFAPVNQPPPADVYQASQGGITYYSMQSQQVIPRVQAKRPKAAIPIVPPPEHKEPRGRGRLSHGEESPVGVPPEMHEGYEIENNTVQYGNDVAVQQ